MSPTAPVVTAQTVRAEQRRAAPWPYADLDVAAMWAAGWRPTPIHDVVLKVHQLCNLSCDYCYVYELADRSWRDRPVAMSSDVWQAALGRLGDHIRRHGLTSVRVVLHGGEPLLYGAARIAELAEAIHTRLPATCAVDIGLQTNGVRLDAAMIQVLRQHRIRAGISVDGVAADHDRHRRTRTGRGSYAAVQTALGLLRRPENRAAYAGILCTVSPDTDPIATYEQLLAFEPPMIDFLLPHANWDQPPRRPAGPPTPYADWLISIFDRWYDGPPRTRVRVFEDVISLLLGGGSRGEQVGLSPSGVLVIESDGAMEQVDALKSAYHGACATGLNVLTDELDTVLDDPGIVARQIGRSALPDECRACPVVAVCGGGHYAHRYRRGEGFRQPSVYCDDLKAFIRHAHRRVSAGLRNLAA